MLNRARSLDGSHITLFGLNLSCLQKGQATPFRSLHKQNETNEIRFGRGSPPLKPLHKWSQISNCPKIAQPLTTTETTIGPPTRERRGSKMKQAVWLHIPGCCPPTLPTLFDWSFRKNKTGLRQGWLELVLYAQVCMPQEHLSRPLWMGWDVNVWSLNQGKQSIWIKKRGSCYSCSEAQTRLLIQSCRNRCLSVEKWRTRSNSWRCPVPSLTNATHTIKNLETSWNILKDLESLLERPNLHDLALRLFEVFFCTASNTPAVCWVRAPFPALRTHVGVLPNPAWKSWNIWNHKAWPKQRPKQRRFRGHDGTIPAVC